tara:strand:- start:1299 stop:1694 length:396 start_codon:yes stop_codon:yes gene_type:complete
LKENLLETLFLQASNDPVTKNTSTKEYKSYMYKGVQIIKENENITIYNPSEMDYYTEIDNLDVFKDGWISGVLRITKQKYLEKLETIKTEIAYEMNNNKNFSKISELREDRDRITKKYREISNKLKSITHE